MKHAVDAEPHAQVVLLRLDVDVGGPVGDRLLDDVVDELDRRRLALDSGELAELLVRDVLGAEEQVLLGVLGDLVELLDRGEDVVLGRDRRLDVVTGEDAQVVEGEHVLRIGHRHEKRRRR